MPCKKYISIRLEPGKTTNVYVDSMTTPKLTFSGKKTFRLESPYVDQTAKGTTLAVEPLRWPPTGYGAAIALSLSARWPYGTRHFEGSDTAGSGQTRSFSGVEFVYDNARKLVWTQDDGSSGTVIFQESSPVWYVTLRIDSASTKTRGRLLVGGVDVS